jgi:hypothetical protein
MSQVINKILFPIDYSCDGSSAPIIARAFVGRAAQMAAVALAIMFLALIGLLANHHSSVGFLAGVFVAGFAGYIAHVVIRRKIIAQDVAFQESLPPFTDSVMPLETIIVALAKHPNRHARRLGKLLVALRESEVPPEDQEALIKIADEVCRGIAYVKVVDRTLDVQPLLAAITYHITRIREGQRLPTSSRSMVAMGAD